MGCASSVHLSQSSLEYQNPSKVERSIFNNFCLCCSKTTETPFDRRKQDDDTTQKLAGTLDDHMEDGKLGAFVGKRSATVLLVFHKTDAVQNAWETACRKFGWKLTCCKGHEEANNLFCEARHDVIILDRRSPNVLDADAVCRTIRSVTLDEYSVICGVVSSLEHTSPDEDLTTMIANGYNTKFAANKSLQVCHDNILVLDQFVTLKKKIRAAHALLAAVEHSSDAIEILDPMTSTVQYVNPTHDRNFGDMKPQLPRDAKTFIQRAGSEGSWQGESSFQIKGKNLRYQCYVQTAGGGQHLVTLRRPILDQFHSQIASTMADLRRRDSLTTRIHTQSVMHDAPILKIISILNNIRDVSPNNASAVDSILDVLKTAELYSPVRNESKILDEMTNDYFGGLINPKRRLSSELSSRASVTGKHWISQANVQASVIESSQYEEQLKNDDKWTFDVIALEKVTKRRPLLHAGLKILRRFNVMEFLDIDEIIICSWLALIEDNYHSSNTYHNSSHATDVLQAAAYFLAKDKLRDSMEVIEQVSILVAAIVHDIDHPGRTNSFITNSNGYLAVLYNDISVLESHHASLAFRLTRKSDCVNIFQNVQRDQYRSIREKIIDAVLATDMTKHFDHVSKFVSSFNDSAKPCLESADSRKLVSRMLIKCADISNPLRSRHLCIEWAKRISEEYFEQTEDEKEKGLPVMMAIFDRNCCNLGKSQTGFINFIIRDMFSAWDEVIPIPELISNLEDNYKFWKDEEERIEEERAQADETN